jgi:hypothetical protein
MKYGLMGNSSYNFYTRCTSGVNPPITISYKGYYLSNFICCGSTQFEDVDYHFLFTTMSCMVVSFRRYQPKKLTIDEWIVRCKISGFA